MSGALLSRIEERAPRSLLRFILGALEAVAVVATYASRTGLAAVLEAGLSVHMYVYVDNNDMVSKAAKHHI